MSDFFGFIQSDIDGSELIFSSINSNKLPREIDYVDSVSEIINQGRLSICVPCSISAYVNWLENIQNGVNDNNQVALSEIYNCRTNKGEGMTFKEAFKFLKNKGVTTANGNFKIQSYGMVKSIEDLKYALVMNGPCVGALPVYSSEWDFWRSKKGRRLEGYHAISLVGYNDIGFVIRNSWGSDFGDNGYSVIPFEEFRSFIEIWTIMN